MSFAYLAERWAEARGMGPWNLLWVPLVCAPFVASALLIGQGVDLLHAHVPGSVIIATCEPTKGGWNCDGPFTATDGSVRVDRVRLYPFFAQGDQPAGPIAARVSGPEANQADWSGEALPVPVWAGVAFGLGGLYLVYSIYLTPGRVKVSASRQRGRRRDGSRRAHT